MPVYATNMTETSRVSVYEIDPYILIVATQGWTVNEWTKAVPDDILYNFLNDWDYSLQVEPDGTHTDVWILDKDSVTYEQEGPDVG